MNRLSSGCRAPNPIDLFRCASLEAKHLAAVSFDGNQLFVSLTPDWDELDRRRRSGALIPDLGLLHALWTLPYGEPVPISDVDERDVETLLMSGSGFVELEGRTVLRRYQPSSTVHAAIARRSTPKEAIRAVGQLPPTMWRIAFSPAAARSSTCQEARDLGIGLATLNGSEALLRVSPAGPIRGVPGIYRWWLAEVATRNWLKQTAPTGPTEASA